MVSSVPPIQHSDALRSEVSSTAGRFPFSGPARFAWSASFGVALLCALAAAFFWPLLSGEATLYFRDTLTFYIPQYVLTLAAWSAGEWPLWEPSIVCGYPYHCDPHSMAFYPPVALFALLPVVWGYNALVVLHVLLAGVFSLLLLRDWGLARLPAFAGSAILMLGGFTVTTTDLTTLLRALTWTPLCVLTFDRWLRGGEARWLAAAAGVLALQGSGTDPNYLAYSWVILLALALARPGQRSRLGVVVALGAVGALAILSLAAIYVPLAELILNSDRLGMASDLLMLYQIHPIDLVNLVVPLPFPDIKTGEYVMSFRDGNPTFYPCLYWGPAALCLIAGSLGWLFRPAAPNRETDPSSAASPGFLRNTVLSCLVLAVTGCLLSLGQFGPLFERMIALLPALSAFRFPAKYFFFTALCGSLLAGLGLEGLNRGNRSCRNIALGASLLVSTAALAAILAFASGDPAAPALFVRGGGVAPGPQRQALFDLVRQGWSGALAHSLAVGLLTAALLVAAGSTPPRRRFATIALGILAVADLAWVTRQSLRTTPVAEAFQPPGTAAAIARATSGSPPGRYITYPQNEIGFGPDFTFYDYFRLCGEMHPGLRGTLFGFQNLLGNTSVATRTQSRLLGLIVRAENRAERDRLAAAAGCAVVVSPEGLGNLPGTGEILASSGPVIARRLSRTSGRAFIPPLASPAGEPSTLPTSTSILALPGEALYDAGRPDGETLSPRAVRECRFVRYARNSLEIRFAIEGKGLLVVLDEDYPGWRAAVDGQPRPIRRVAGVFRGVEIAEGESTLTMEYAPASFRVGCAISVITLAILLWAMLRISARGKTRPTAEGRSG